MSYYVQLSFKLSFLGSWVKCGSLSPDRFMVTMFGQTIVAISQVFILGIPSQLAGVWFSAEEVSRACAVGVFGNQVSCDSEWKLHSC